MEEDINNIKNNFFTLFRSNEIITQNIKNIEEDIEHLKVIHTQIIKNSDKRIGFYNYGIYVDDIHIQKVILEKELKLIKKVLSISLRKAYCDVFRLLLKIIRTIEENKYEALPILNSTPKNTDVFNRNKKDFLNSVVIYDEIDDKKIYTMNDLDNLFNVFIKVYKILDESIENLEKYTKIIETRCEEGYSVKMLHISLQGELTKLITDKKNYFIILNEIINSKIIQFKKYLDRSIIIANDLKDNIKETIKKELDEEKQYKEIALNTDNEYE